MKQARAILLLCLNLYFFHQNVIAAAAARSQPTSASNDITAQQMMPEDSKVFASSFEPKTPEDNKIKNYDVSAAVSTAATRTGFTEAVADKICLKELSRSPHVVPTPDVPRQTFTTTFACCEEPGVAVAGCKFQTSSLTKAKLAGQSMQLDKQVGTFEAWCVFKRSGVCVPPDMQGRMFSTTPDSSQQYWLEMDSLLYNYLLEPSKNAKTMSRTMAHGAHSGGTQWIRPQATRGVADTLTEPPHTAAGHNGMVLGKVSQFSARVKSSAGLVKGGTLEYTAGAVDSLGNVACPTPVSAGQDAHSTSAQPSPFTNCGLLVLTLSYVDRDNSGSYNKAKSAVDSNMQSSTDTTTAPVSRGTKEGSGAGLESIDLLDGDTKQQQAQFGSDKDAEMQEDANDFWEPRRRKTSRPARIAHRRKPSVWQ